MKGVAKYGHPSMESEGLSDQARQTSEVYSSHTFDDLQIFGDRAFGFGEGLGVAVGLGGLAVLLQPASLSVEAVIP